MRKFILLGLSIFILTGVFVYAQEDETEENPPARMIQNREEIRDRMQEKREEMRGEISEKREEVRQTITERKEARKVQLQANAQERVLKITGKIFERFDAVLIKFDGITQRIESRITKLEEEGSDMTEARSALEDAQSNATETTALILATKEEIELLVSDESSKEGIRTLMTQVKVSLQETKKSFLKIISLIETSKDNI